MPSVLNVSVTLGIVPCQPTNWQFCPTTPGQRSAYPALPSLTDCSTHRTVNVFPAPRMYGPTAQVAVRPANSIKKPPPNPSSTQADPPHACWSVSTPLPLMLITLESFVHQAGDPLGEASVTDRVAAGIGPL